ncbi:hypothetical protein LCGC14_2980750 [marine sediment metagenome]|uniref:Uncharacterized protein n=1 Tax=marine sediment metagenome TaxID=412755 RepID=A0A0F8XU67_9ZZZZ
MTMTDEEYVTCRNRLIPEAVGYTKMLLGVYPQQTEEATRLFLRKMDDLAISAGLVKKGIY